MAKCSICNSRKGKRRCLIAGGLVCSLCCGNTRKPETCSECGFYKKPKRKYNDVPAYSVSEMDGNMELESYGNTVEGALCSYDIENENKLNDSDAIRIIELLIDIYHFKDQQMDTDSQVIANGVTYVKDAMISDLKDVDNEIIVKILGVIRFVAKRRTKIGREYMKIIHQYVGPRIGDLPILQR
ncbi:hypothetical protein BuS5_03157 [Desulfosarcina sp. BuS5]|uniref:hypothetical protein n=1 Tax=Desulfosarcina sp. BuS5 TaxID=933262 RepID=UPI00047F15CA|nr:hypothetical protein [Desulfosarcina sp. BuS5]WDN90187.1 hypothetical protein BuS5_03157 [Desulfosarcina sp. BuS5]